MGCAQKVLLKLIVQNRGQLIRKLTLNVPILVPSGHDTKHRKLVIKDRSRLFPATTTPFWSLGPQDRGGAGSALSRALRWHLFWAFLPFLVVCCHLCLGFDLWLRPHMGFLLRVYLSPNPNLLSHRTTAGQSWRWERAPRCQWPFLSPKHLCPLLWGSKQVSCGQGSPARSACCPGGFLQPFSVPDFPLSLQVTQALVGLHLPNPFPPGHVHTQGEQMP